MGQVFFKDRYGLTQGFNIAGEQPDEYETAYIQSALSGNPAPTAPSAPVDDTGILSALGSGVGRGWNQMQAGAGGLAALAARTISPTGQVGGSTAEEWDAYRKQQEEEEKGYYTPEGSFFDQEGAFDTARYLASQQGQSTPATIGAIVGGIGGSLVGGPIGGVAGSVALGTLFAGAASLPQAYEGNLEEQEQTHGKVTNEGKAFVGALGQSALEGLADRLTLGAAKIVGGAVPEVAKGIIKGATEGAIKKAALTVGESTITGMSTEAVTEALQQGIQRWQADKPLGGPEAQKEYLESAIVGGLLGGVTGGAFGGVGAALEAKDNAKFKMISDDLAAQDSVGNFVEQNRADREKRAASELLAEEALQVPNARLIEDLRLEQDLLTGPEGAIPAPVAKKPPMPSSDIGAAVRPAPEAGAGSISSRPQPFSEQEYTDAVTRMRGKGLISPDKIKNDMKIGRNKATAIFNAMQERTDARYAGHTGKYLTVVDKSTDGNVETKQSTKPNEAPKISRRYEVRPIQEADAQPFSIRRAADGKNLTPTFKSAEDAASFADQHKVGDYSVIQNSSLPKHGVYEVTSGVAGSKPTARFVKAYPTEAEARQHVNGLNPQLSPETNQIQQQSQRQKDIAARDAQKMGKHQNVVQQLVDQIMGPGRTVVDLSEAINTPDGKGIDTDNYIEGNVGLVNGIRRMQIATGILKPGMSPDEFQNAINSVAHHEVLHAAKSAGLFTPQEWANMVRRSNTRVAGKPY